MAVPGPEVASLGVPLLSLSKGVEVKIIHVGWMNGSPLEGGAFMRWTEKRKRPFPAATLAAISLFSILLVCGSLVVGCGGKEAVETPEGSMEPQVSVEMADESGGSLTVEGTGPSGEPVQAKVDIRREKPGEGDLGAPVYPKAQYSQDSGATARVSAEGKELHLTAADFISSDPYRTVVDWYRKKIGEPLMSLAEETTWIKSGGERSLVTVTVRVQEGKTWINIRRLDGDLDLPLPQMPNTSE